MSSAAALRRLAARAAATAARHAFPRVAATSGGVLAESATKASSAAASPFRSALRGFAAEAAPASAAASGVATGKVTQVRRCGEMSKRVLVAQWGRGRNGVEEAKKKKGDDWKKGGLHWLLCLLFWRTAFRRQGRGASFFSRPQGAVCDWFRRVSESGEVFEGFKAVEFAPTPWRGTSAQGPPR